MPSLMTVELKGLRFHAFHGLYAEEKKAGNEFEVNIAVSFVPDVQIITKLDESVNYSKLYAILKDEMQKPRELLETFVMELAEKINNSFALVRKVEISIHKLHPPIINFAGSVGVKFSKEY